MIDTRPIFETLRKPKFVYNKPQIPIVGIVKETEDAIIPTKAHEGDACYDLYSSEDLHVWPDTGPKLVSTSLIMSIPDGWAGFIHDRSSIGLKGIRTMGGVIDSTYRGIVKVILFNLGRSIFQVQKGDRIAQIEFRPVYDAEFQEGVISDTQRGDGGFGSSGI
jgi:dUTP pyrophosphatase